MQYVCKNVHKLVFPLNTVYLYTVSNLHINVLLLGQHVEKRIVIMGVINGQMFIIYLIFNKTIDQLYIFLFNCYVSQNAQ